MRPRQQQQRLAGLGVLERDATRKAGFRIGDDAAHATRGQHRVVERKQVAERLRRQSADAKTHGALR
jgi:hypothetical protein